MPSLEQVQLGMMQAIALGPDHAPFELFDGGQARALRGLSVHANTISHARLMALEETFPRTRLLLGEGLFNQLSRSFVEIEGAGALRLTDIGRGFPEWLAAVGQSAAAIGLARFEKAWLQCYHAAEAPAFGLADLAALGESGIADLRLAHHPASAVVELAAKSRAELDGDLAEPFILITRPGAQVQITALSSSAARLFSALSHPSAVCNLLDELAECNGEQALLALLAAGALIRIEEANPLC